MECDLKVLSEKIRSGEARLIGMQYTRVDGTEWATLQVKSGGMVFQFQFTNRREWQNL